MLLGEPPPSQADLHFRLFGFPVRVHPFFWLVTLLLGMGGGEKAEPVGVLVWVAVVFVSILVHELGHALMQRRFGGRPWITLYSFGGLASCNDCDRSPRSQIIILLAGPGAGFLLAALIVLGLVLAGRNVDLTLFGIQWSLGQGQFGWSWAQPFAVFGADFTRFSSWVINLSIFILLYVNIVWGLVNLLPVYPLDGGQIARELFTLGNPRRGIVQSLRLSVGTGAAMAVYALTQNSFFSCLMFGLLAYSSYQALRSYEHHWR